MSGESSVDYRDLLKRAYLQIKDLQAKVDALEQGAAEPMAVIGYACRFPGDVDTPEAFWDVLRQGRDVLQDVPPDRWNIDDYYDPTPGTPNKQYSRRAGFLTGIADFDARFFGIAPREALSIDPQQRMLMEVSWEALERSGYAPDRLGGTSTGVFVGISSYDYLQRGHGHRSDIDLYTGTGVLFSVAAGRLAYLLGLQGPTLSVDTACSSSLVATHLACRSLQQRECHMALVGGVNAILAPYAMLLFSRMHALAPDGRCKTFDAAADGYARGEGCGVLVLKRLADAQAAGDNILAVIRGSAVNHDGRSSGLTAPNGLAQQALIRAALAAARVAPAQIQYLEAHGTGTPLGDPIEAQAAQVELGKQRPADWPLVIGSVKTNVGHLEAAAGMASLFKVILSLQHETIPAHLNFKQLNPHINWDACPVIIPTQARAWPRGDQPRLAGVSAFGFSGTNAHLIIEEAPLRASGLPQPERPRHLLSLSAKSEAALAQLADRIAQYLDAHPASSLADLCYTLNVGRAQFDHRLALVVDAIDQARTALRDRASSEVWRPSSVQPPADVVFMFSGQGAQYVGMGQQLYETQPVFRATLDRCAEILKPLLDRPLLDVMFGRGEAGALLDQTAYTQPALFALEYALATLWRSWGVEPAAVLGHSIGEYVAACVAGVFSLEDALRLVAARGRFMQALPCGGVMAAIFADEARVRAALPATGAIAIAAINTPQETVISGAAEVVQTVVASLQAAGIEARWLTVSHAFHSPLMEPMLATFEREAATMAYAPPSIDLISNVTGQLITLDEVRQSAYWRRHAREAVRFEQGVRTLHERGYRCFVEVGPGAALTHMGQQIYPEANDVVWLSSLRKGRNEWEMLLNSLGLLYAHGLPIDWAGFDRPYPRRRLELPTYPFQRERYWIDYDTSESALPVASPPAWTQWLYDLEWRALDDEVVRPTTELGRWLILADSTGVAEAFQQQLTAQGHECVLIRSTETAAGLWIDPLDARGMQRVMAEYAPYRGVIYLWGLDAPSGPDLTAEHLLAAQRLTCGGALHVIQALAATQLLQPPLLWLITRGAQLISSLDAAPALSQALLWGLGRVMALEHAELWGGLIDLDPAVSGDAQNIAPAIRVIQQAGPENQIALRSGKKYAPRLTRHTTALYSAELTHLSSEGAYLVIGGLGGLGLVTTHWLVERGARQLVLMARHAPNDQARAAIEQFERAGVKVILAQGDVTRWDDLSQVFTTIQQSGVTLRGVIHAAGVLEDGALVNQAWEHFTRVLATKVDGAWNVHQLTQNLSLDFCLFFSSATALLGSAGQANYGAANNFLDALAHYRRRLGLPAATINWGPWAGVGMAASSASRTAAIWTKLGIEHITPAQGVAILDWVLAQSPAQIGVMPIEWNQFAAHATNRPSPLIREVLKTQVAAASQSTPLVSARPDLVAQMEQAAPPQRLEIVRLFVQQQVARAARLPQADVPRDGNLLERGLDSLTIMEVLNACKRALQLVLYPREFYARPTIDAFSRYLVEEFTRRHQSGPPVTNASPANPIVATATRRFRQPLQRNPSMVFLLSTPRAGSTLLRAMLAGHPGLFCPPELHLLNFEDLQERQAQLGQSYLSEGLPRAWMELRGLDSTASQLLLEEAIGQAHPTEQVYRQLQDWAAPRVLIDKSPSYGLEPMVLQRAEELFDQPRYVFLVRHPYAVVESFVRMRMDKLLHDNGEDPWQVAEQVWTTINHNILQFLQQVDPARQLLVRYETLLREPRQTLTEICDFLKVPFTEAVLDPYTGARMTDGLHAQSVPIGDPNFVRRGRLQPELAEAWRAVQLPQALDAEAQTIAARLSYELPAVEKNPESTTVAHLSTPMEEHFYEVNGLRHCVCAWGPVTGPLVVCVHGLFDQGAGWIDVAQRLATQGYRVVAPDLRGHGRSEHIGAGGSYHFVDFVADLSGLISQFGHEPIALVGHSLGSIVIGLYASAHPSQQAAVVLIENDLLPVEHQLDLATQLRLHLDQSSPATRRVVLPSREAAIARLRQAVPTLPAVQALRLIERNTEVVAGGVVWRWDPRLETRTSLMLDGLGVGAAYWSALEPIQLRVTIITAQTHVQKQYTTPAIRLPHAQHVVLPGDHNLQWEQPEAVARLIVQATAQLAVSPTEVRI